MNPDVRKLSEEALHALRESYRQLDRAAWRFEQCQKRGVPYPAAARVQLCEKLRRDLFLLGSVVSRDLGKEIEP